MMIGIFIIIAFLAGSGATCFAFSFSMQAMNRFPEKTAKRSRRTRTEKPAKVEAYSIEV